jgi:protein-tyrosine phosphatase
MAEGILQKLADEKGLGWTVHSSGTNGLHTGEPPHKSSQKVCKENGLDISEQRSMEFEAIHFVEYDKIYVFAADVMRDVKEIAGEQFDESKIDFFLNELYSGQNQDVIDPWYGGEDGYYDVFEQIQKGCEAIISKYHE